MTAQLCQCIPPCFAAFLFIPMFTLCMGLWLCCAQKWFSLYISYLGFIKILGSEVDYFFLYQLECEHRNILSMCRILSCSWDIYTLGVPRSKDNCFFCPLSSSLDSDYIYVNSAWYCHKILSNLFSLLFLEWMIPMALSSISLTLSSAISNLLSFGKFSILDEIPSWNFHLVLIYSFHLCPEIPHLFTYWDHIFL